MFQARKFQPTIIFIDEIGKKALRVNSNKLPYMLRFSDSFLRERQSFDHEATAMMKAQFMSLWDGKRFCFFDSFVYNWYDISGFSSSDQDVIIMGATNRPQDVDAAILRRMPARFNVPVPVSAIHDLSYISVIWLGRLPDTSLTLHKLIRHKLTDT